MACNFIRDDKGNVVAVMCGKRDSSDIGKVIEEPDKVRFYHSEFFTITTEYETVTSFNIDFWKSDEQGENYVSLRDIAKELDCNVVVVAKESALEGVEYKFDGWVWKINRITDGYA